MSDVRGTVLGGTGGVWRIRGTDGTECDASLRGRLKQDGVKMKLAVGDIVTIDRDAPADGWSITAIHPRRSVLARRSPSGARGQRIIAANVDQVVIVFAAAKPEPHVRMLDRFLIIAEGNDLPVRIVLNKVDLVGGPSGVGEIAQVYERAGYTVHRTSVKGREGLDVLHDALAGRTSVLSGPSGVGKSSLLNALYPGLSLRTGEISESVNKGRHTTVGALFVPLTDEAGGYVVDTPGLREVGMWGLSPEHLDRCFPEFKPFLGECKFQDCAHEGEPNCAVRAAVKSGNVSAARYESYLKLRGELTEGEKPWA